MSSRHLYRRAIVLGLLVAVGAFAIDMYIPGFAAIARDLHTDPGTVQLSMTSFFLALAAGQVVYGPISDAVGRKPPIYVGLSVFIAGSVAAALAPSIDTLIAARLFQGLGAAATAVIPMAVIRDEHTGPDAARLMSLATLALSVSPILAPVFGGFLVEYTSWRMIFLMLILIALLVAAMTLRFLPETLPRNRRVSAHPASILRTYGTLIGTRRFILPIMVLSFGTSVLFAFISAAPFVFVTLHHVKPTEFGLIFAVHAVALIGTSQLNAMLIRKFGSLRLIGCAASVLAAASIALVAVVFSGTHSLWPLVAVTLTMFTSLAPILAPAFLLAMEPFGATAGAAAAIGSGVEFGLSTVVTLLMGLSADGTARPMAITLAASAFGAFACWIVVASFPSRVPA